MIKAIVLLLLLLSLLYKTGPESFKSNDETKERKRTAVDVF